MVNRIKIRTPQLQMNVVFDLDGTLSLDDHRQHYLLQEEKDWHRYFANCDLDTPNQPIIETMHALLEEGHHVEIWSGRSEGENLIWRNKTMIWLRQHALIFFPGFDYPPKANRLANFVWKPEYLKMRPHEDFSPDIELKGKWLEEATNAGIRPDLVFEDRTRVVEFYQSQNIACVQVAQNDR